MSDNVLDGAVSHSVDTQIVDIQERKGLILLWSFGSIPFH
jgi:hypothetical protein